MSELLCDNNSVKTRVNRSDFDSTANELIVGKY